MNSLEHASSSYLRSAMHQPIKWHEWGEAAFSAAKQEDKPILLDIGAVWCHWCHVMDRESYDNPAIAAMINENFIAIKVDRDERPDVDSRYQAAVQAISGQGGWPLTAFLTPDGRPFFGGTYFPPDDHYGRPGFARVLKSIANAYKDKRTDVMESAESVMGAIEHQEAFKGRSGSIDKSTIVHIIDSGRKMFDPMHGGFGDKPKFPHSSAIDLVIDDFARSGDEQLENIIDKTLEKMATGGVYDQLAGGFHRYSVDEKWIVPHFEKMAYDNSELLKNYVHAYQVTGSPLFSAIAQDIIRWVDEWLSDRDHSGFYASQDADINLEDDGDYFTWTFDEARAVLTADELAVAAEYYDIGEVGEMHHNPHKNVLFVKTGMEAIAKKSGRADDDVLKLLASARKKMYAARLQRPTPYIDKTIYVNWNAMMVSAYLDAALVLDLEEPRTFALRSLDRVLSSAWDAKSGRLNHVVAYSDPAAPHRVVAGMLDDYALTAIACLDAYCATADISYFKFAQAITDAMLARFADETGGGFFDMDVKADPTGLIGALTARRKPLQDSPTPAGNSVAAIALMRLFHLANDAKYKDAAEDTLETFAGVVSHFGIFAGSFAIALRLFIEPAIQVVVVGNDAKAQELHAAAVASFAVGKEVIRLRSEQAVAQNLPPALAETIPQIPAVKKGDSVAIICSGFACQPPITDVQELSKAISLAISGKR